MIQAICLDLEGTLISSAVSQFPRPHVRQFLDFCCSLNKNLFWLTSVNQPKVEGIINLLIEEGYFPEEVMTIKYLPWQDKHSIKRLDLTGFSPEEVLAIDDYPEIYVPEHQSQVIKVKCFESPYSSEDTELLSIQHQLEMRLK